MTTVCLTMIVRNEESVIRRCIEAARPFVDAVAIVDTGSRDKTLEQVREATRGLPLALEESRWKGFGESRNESLDLGRKQGCDYLLLLDAANVWRPEEGFSWGRLRAPGYLVRYQMGSEAWYRPGLLKSNTEARFVGRVQEYLEGEAIQTKFSGAYVEAREDGHRRTVQGTAKYLQVAEVLEEELAEDPTNRRNMFYLAQAYRDAEEPAKALRWYQRRARSGGDPEQAWCAKYQAAKMMIQLEYSPEEVIATFLEAYDMRPQRAEALVHGAAYCRARGRFASAYLMARTAAEIPPTEDLFHLDTTCGWRALAELAVCAHQIGRMDVAIETGVELLKREDLPLAERKVVEENLRLAATEAQSALD